ncbi:hypothetical protein BZA77DRAFT_359619 [Pyronema omphalodes]|nr:hypothetical protein BZA77DRAFT_359619 [Pyronema omphalodes]
MKDDPALTMSRERSDERLGENEGEELWTELGEPRRSNRVLTAEELLAEVDAMGEIDPSEPMHIPTTPTQEDEELSFGSILGNSPDRPSLFDTLSSPDSPDQASPSSPSSVIKPIVPLTAGLPLSDIGSTTSTDSLIRRALSTLAPLNLAAEVERRLLQGGSASASLSAPSTTGSSCMDGKFGSIDSILDSSESTSQVSGWLDELPSPLLDPGASNVARESILSPIREEDLPLTSPSPGDSPYCVQPFSAAEMAMARAQELEQRSDATPLLGESAAEPGLASHSTPIGILHLRGSPQSSYGSPDYQILPSPGEDTEPLLGSSAAEPRLTSHSTPIDTLHPRGSPQSSCGSPEYQFLPSPGEDTVPLLGSSTSQTSQLSDDSQSSLHSQESIRPALPAPVDSGFRSALSSNATSLVASPAAVTKSRSEGMAGQQSTPLPSTSPLQGPEAESRNMTSGETNVVGAVGESSRRGAGGGVNEQTAAPTTTAGPSGSNDSPTRADSIAGPSVAPKKDKKEKKGLGTLLGSIQRRFGRKDKEGQVG